MKPSAIFAGMETEALGNDDFQSDLSYYLNQLISGGKENILQRVGKGIYRFSDPRMPSFVRMNEVNQGSDKKSS